VFGGRLGLFNGKSVDRWATFFVIAVIVASRWAAFPASLWDRDEAIFARALVHFEPESLYPHPPFFPLWIALGRLVFLSPLTNSPEVALQLLSSAMSVWIVFPLARLWRHLLPRYQASLAALLYAMIPAPWVLSGRGYSGGTGTAMLVAAAALLLQDRRPSTEHWIGAIYLAAALLVRPQLLPFALAICVWRLTREKNIGRAIGPVLLAVGIVLMVAVWMTTRCGGVRGVLDIVAVHVQYHFGKMERVVLRAVDLGMVAGLGGGKAAIGWLVLTIQGAVVLVLLRPRKEVTFGFLMVLTIPAFYIQVCLQNPTFVRYALPGYAFSSGLVVAAVAWIMNSRIRTIVIVGAFCALDALMVIPHLHNYRHNKAPVVRALEEVASSWPGEPSCLVVDPHLETFVDLFTITGRIHAEVNLLPRKTEGLSTSLFQAPGQHLLAVLDDQKGRWNVHGACRTVHEWRSTPWFARIVTPRFRRVVVIYGTVRTEATPSAFIGTPLKAGEE